MAAPPPGYPVTGGSAPAPYSTGAGPSYARGGPPFDGADKATAHGKVVEVIDLVRQEGVAKFAINIDPVAPPPAAAPVGDGAAPAAP